MPDPTKTAWVQWLLVLVQVATLVSVIVYVWKTWVMAKAAVDTARATERTLDELRSSRKLASAPRVVVYFETAGDHLAHIVMENVGESTARDIVIEFSPPLASSSGPSATKFFDTPKVLAPHAAVRHLLDSWPSYFRAKLPMKYEATVRYRSAVDGDAFETPQVLDAGAFENLHFVNRKGTHHLVEEVAKLRESLERAMQKAQGQKEDALDSLELVSVAPGTPVAIGRVRAAWDLYDQMERDNTVFVNADALRMLLRRSVWSAIQACADGRVGEEREKLLRDVFAALHDRHFHYMNNDEAQSRLRNAMNALLGRPNAHTAHDPE